MQKILTNISQGLIFHELINEENVLKVINGILSNNKQKKIDFLELRKISKFNINEHLGYIEELRQYFETNSQNTMIENKINQTLGKFIPSQKEINKLFINKDKYEKLLSLSTVAYYIKTDKNALNVLWTHETKYGEINISINNAKPEKSQAQIIKEKNYVSENKNEPKCPICIENINFEGSLVKDSRENLRVVLETLDKQKENEWFFQYSPYAYINKHFVLNNIEHKPMVITNDTVKNLVEFTNQNDNFFLGSNADLSIVGGSLLGHNHYQGGEDILPIMNAKILQSFTFQEAIIDVLDWPLNAIKISLNDKNKIIDIANFFVNGWKGNSDYGLKSINNSTTIIVNKINGIFNVYLIFRNNSTSTTKPFGNFHIDPSKFHIKQENIGLMEAGGLAILPKRLISELQEIIDIFDPNNLDLILQNENLTKHYLWIKKMLKNKIAINKENLLKDMSDIFVSCLEDCKVLKDKDFIQFINNKIQTNQEVFTIKNETGLKVEIMRKGFTVKQIQLNNKSFLMEYQDIDSYFTNNDIFLNSFVGPAAGRIEKGIVKFDNKEIKLKTDNNDNYMHGMNEKWSDIIFDISIKSFDDFDILEGHADQHHIELDSLFIFDLNLKIWRHENKIEFGYNIRTDKPTICNPTHHLYWKMPDTKNLWDLNMEINSNNYWSLNKNFNPQKKEQWMMNGFQKLSDIKNKIGIEQTELVGGGIDHPIELVKDSRVVLSSPDFKSTINANSTLTNVVIYTHNWKSNNPLLNFNSDTHQAICFEYQSVPTSINNPNFDKIIINKDKPYIHNTTYKFEIK